MRGKQCLMALALMLAFVTGVQPCFGAIKSERSVSVALPRFDVQINGTLVNSKTAEYPLLVYQGITYMPMTYDYCNLLGITSNWTKEGGLVVAKQEESTIPTVTEKPARYFNPSKAMATIISTPVTINNKKIDNARETYPVLRYKEITYFPLTFRFTKDEFNIYAYFLPETGLGVYSENKFFYNYYPKGSKLQHTDLRISTILYQMVAINVTDGTGRYPANNVKMYQFQDCGVPLTPNYKDTKYYGYVSDGKGGLKADIDSRMWSGGLLTTAISDPKNPEPTQIELTFAQFYEE